MKCVFYIMAVVAVENSSNFFVVIMGWRHKKKLPMKVGIIFRFTYYSESSETNDKL